MQCVTERVKPVLTSTTRIRLPWQCERSRCGYRTPAMEGDPLPIRRPRRPIVAPALGGVGDLADVASIGVHRENGVAAILLAKDDQTVSGSSATARALLVLLASLKVGGSSITARALLVLLVSGTLSRLFTSTGAQ